MTERKQKAVLPPDMSFDEALERFTQTIPSELAETVAADVLKGRDRIKKRIQKVRQEIEDGALPKKRKFRL